MRRIIILIWLTGLIVSCGSEPKSFDEYKAAGMRAFTDNEYGKAREYLKEALKLNQSDKDVLYFLGMAFKREYYYDSALYYLKRADILYPQDREINLELYEIALATEQWDYAIKAVNALIASGDPPENYYETLADLYARTDYPLNVYYYLKKIYERGTDQLKNYLQLADVCGVVDSVKEGFLVLDSAERIFGPLDSLELVRARLYVKEDSLKKAESMLRGLYKKDSTDVSYKFNLANVLSYQDSKAKKKEAIALYKSIREYLSPKLNMDSVITSLEDEVK